MRAPPLGGSLKAKVPTFHLHSNQATELTCAEAWSNSVESPFYMREGDKYLISRTIVECGRSLGIGLPVRALQSEDILPVHCEKKKRARNHWTSVDN